MTDEYGLWPWERRRSEPNSVGVTQSDMTHEWQERIRVLERELAGLKEEVRRLRHQKVEYRIDQLHIESLEGILNIGLSTTADEEQLAALQAARGDAKEDQHGVDSISQSDAGTQTKLPRKET